MTASRPKSVKPSLSVPRYRRPRNPGPQVTPDEILTDLQADEPGKVAVVLVRWIDALGLVDWEDADSWQPCLAPSFAIGAVVEHTEEHISLVALGNSNHYSHGITIPLGCVIGEIVRLR